MNLYGYAGGDPINFSDPFGLCPDSLSTAEREECEKKEAEEKEARRQAVNACVERNTEWMTGPAGDALGLSLFAGGALAMLTGAGANYVGNQMLAAGGAGLDDFFRGSNASAMNLEDAIRVQGGGRAAVQRGRSLVRGGGATILGAAAFVASYVGTTQLACMRNPDR